MFDDPDRDDEDPESAATPDVPDPTPEIPDPSDAPRELKIAFWRLVVVFNVALLATSLGVMLVGFEGRLRQGGSLFVLGLVAFAYGFWRYRDRPREF